MSITLVLVMLAKPLMAFGAISGLASIRRKIKKSMPDSKLKNMMLMHLWYTDNERPKALPQTSTALKQLAPPRR